MLDAQNRGYNVLCCGDINLTHDFTEVDNKSTGNAFYDAMAAVNMRPIVRGHKTYRKYKNHHIASSIDQVFISRRLDASISSTASKLQLFRRNN